jgi:drug/metabolite transporter (DMT)-like permease
LTSTTPPRQTELSSPFPGIALVHYPAAWGAVFGIVALLADVAVLVIVRRRRRPRVRNMAMGFAAAIAPVFLAVLLGAIAAGLYERSHRQTNGQRAAGTRGLRSRARSPPGR